MATEISNEDQELLGLLKKLKGKEYNEKNKKTGHSITTNVNKYGIYNNNWEGTRYGA